MIVAEALANLVIITCSRRNEGVPDQEIRCIKDEITISEVIKKRQNDNENNLKIRNWKTQQITC